MRRTCESIMAVAGMYIQDRAGLTANLNDYSLYSDLSDDELMQLAIERSLTENHILTSADQRQPAVQNQPNRCVRLNSETKYSYYFDTNRPPPDYEPENNVMLTPSSANPSPSLPLDYSPLMSLIKHGQMKTLKEITISNPGVFIKPFTDGWVALHEAAYYGQEECLNLFLDVNPEVVNQRSLTGQTPLYLACSSTHMACVRCLLLRGADPNIPNMQRETPLYRACANASEKIVEILLSFGATVNKGVQYEQTPLHEAARLGHQKICRKLLKAGAKIDGSDVNGIKPFFTAAQNGQTDILTFLIENGADKNSQANDGATALYEASKNGCEETVKLLLGLRADANKETKSGILPIHIATRRGRPSIVQMLICATAMTKVKECGISPLHIAAEYNQDDMLEMLIEADFDVNFQLSVDQSKMYQDRRTTALYFSVYNCNVEAATMLLEAGANPNLDTVNPLFVAVRQGPIELFHLLVEHGANVNAHNPTQPSTFPFVLVFCMKYLSILKYLLTSGCDAVSCFDCMYGSRPHPPVQVTQSVYDSHSTNGSPKRYFQFCDAISEPSVHPWTKEVLSILLDYVGHVQLCSRLQEHLDSCGDWSDVKDKTMSPRPLMHLSRMMIRQLMGAQRLKHINSLPLPKSLIKFLNYDIKNH
ncbi:ankyrin repeat and SOCS box protein 2-like isoform X2 [Hypomesus transpacificus]|uniref:ankyrin repeat and SOCS box protein 2-like isoform X2 n=1 Tax=Hypomesus transpacificus TaxID=137520 RepID=UPI001F0717BF|nr:ankyrin repeat and SOCS box protein 2-like isoform X2 [Hypomesus transpacificus]